MSDLSRLRDVLAEAGKLLEQSGVHFLIVARMPGDMKAPLQLASNVDNASIKKMLKTVEEKIDKAVPTNVHAGEKH